MNRDPELEERLRRLSWPVDRGGGWASVEAQAGGRKRASTPRKTSGLRIALYASLAVVIVAALTVGSLKAVKTVKHLGKDQFTLVITDDPTIITPDTTGQDIQTSTSEPSTAMFRGNAARTGVYPSGGPIDPPELLWKFKTGAGEGSSPCRLRWHVYVAGSDRYLYALDAQSGEEKWKFGLMRLHYEWATASSPAVADGRGLLRHCRWLSLRAGCSGMGGRSGSSWRSMD